MSIFNILHNKVIVIKKLSGLPEQNLPFSNYFLTTLKWLSFRKPP